MLVGVLLLGKQAMLVLPEQDSLLERQRERQRRGGTYQEVARDALAVAEVGGHTPRDVHHVQHLVSRARTCVRVCVYARAPTCGQRRCRPQAGARQTDAALGSCSSWHRSTSSKRRTAGAGTLTPLRLSYEARSLGSKWPDLTLSAFALLLAVSTLWICRRRRAHGST